MVPFHLVLAALFGWLEREQRDVIEFLREENRVLKGSCARFLDRLEDWGLITGSPRGFYPWFGSVYAAGVGARKPFGDDGVLRAQFDDFRERDNDLYSFQSLEGEVLQLIPILRANWVIALHGLATAARMR